MKTMKFIILILTLIALITSYRIHREASKTQTELKSTETSTKKTSDDINNSANTKDIIDESTKLDSQSAESHAEVNDKVTSKKPSGKEMVEPEIRKYDNPADPVFYKSPPNYDEKYIHKFTDAFNPNKHPMFIPQYPEYDVLPEVDHFWQSEWVPLGKTRKTATEADVVQGLKNQMGDLKKQIFGRKNASTAEVRKENNGKGTYDANWLAMQLRISRIVELEDRINKEKKEKASA